MSVESSAQAVESTRGLAERFPFIATPAVDPVRLLPRFAGAWRKHLRGVERKVDGWARVNPEAALTAELRSLLARC